jgi:uncharacterized cupredoxin-like copper-binding protein
VFLLDAYDIEPGSYTPKIMTMLDFNLWTFNSRIFPGIDSMNVRQGDRVRVRIGNLTMTNHPMHIHGHEFQITGTDGGPTPKSARWHEVTADIGVGQLRQLEFIPDIERGTVMKHKIVALAVLAALSLGTHAHEGATHASKSGAVRKEQTDWGIAGDAKAAKRTIQVVMSDDMRFTPNLIEVKKGETVRIVVSNRGQMLHEFVLGSKKELEEHAALMFKFPNMEHDEPYMVHVPPGRSGEMIWTFNRAGEFDFACLVAGHYQAGMVGKVKVS